MLLEICVENLESAFVAESSGAHRIELCSNLFEGGLTPSFDLLKEVKEKIKIPVHVMIRPRNGDFCYSDIEFEQMKSEIKQAKELQASGVVFGILTLNKNIDVTRTKQLVELAKPMKTVFHRAFDEARKPFESLKNIIDCCINILLTSGQKETAEKGQELIGRLHKHANNRICIMAGSGITDKNILEIAGNTGIRSFHGSAKANPVQQEIFADAGMIRKMRTLLNALK